MTNIDEINGRFKDAPWYEKSKNEVIHLVGLGGIGSNFLYCATKTIPCKYFIQDMDTVESYNVGTQFFDLEDVNKLKVQVCKDKVKKHHPYTSIYSNTSPFEEHNSVGIIAIAALDNMKTRKDMFESWKSMKTRELFIDARLRANFYEIYVVTPGKEEDYEKTLFDDSEVDEGPCTFKATSYFGMLCGARITHVLVNYLSNKYSENPIYTVPFKISEFGDLFYYECNN